MSQRFDARGKKWFVHLSDIHFRKKKGDSYDPYDLDEDLRDQLELDLARLRTLLDVPFDGIILSGDSTFQATEPEFDVAFKWLRRVSEVCGCPPEAVYCVPGNHDADRSVYDNSLMLRQLHDRLRPGDGGHVDALLGEALHDADAAATLFRPIEQYNRFAAKFGCQTKGTQLAWEHRVLLNDGSTLVLRGANSVLVSNWSDDNKAHKLILGTLQATARERANEAVVFICHHSIDWLLDYDQLIPTLNARARVQLFGHKHTQIVEEINNCLRIVAGAVHPDRREPGWRPRYNCVGFSVRGAGAQRKLIVDLYPRVWGETEPRYIADYGACRGQEQRTFLLDLATWSAPATTIPVAPSSLLATLTTDGGETMDPARTLTYRFLSLPHVVRLEIAQAMKLLHEEDEGIQDAILFERILQRAAVEKRLAALWDEVEARHDDKQPANLFAGR